MRRAAACVASLWVTSALAAGSPSDFLNFSYRLDGRALQLSTGVSREVSREVSRNALPVSLEDLLPKPERAPGASLPEVRALRIYDDVWERIRDGFAIEDIDAPLVKRWQAWYLARPQILKSITERSRPYLFHIVEELAARGMPLELALLPMVESGYDPNALSQANAAGLWQFIPETGRRYNLPQSTEYDARRDVVASTSAALDYLKFLHDLFGDWPLALAAYNWGEKAVGGAIERNRAKGLAGNYVALTLPEETRNYVPKLLALKHLLVNARELRLEREPVPNRAYFTAVEKPRDLDLHASAKLADMPLQGFLALNPAYTGSVMPGKTPSGAQSSILLPVEKAALFRANIARYNQSRPLSKVSKANRAAPHEWSAAAAEVRPGAARRTPVVHQVKRGETLPE